MVNTENREYKQVPRDALDCPAFLEDMVGYTGEKFCDRPVVLFRQRPGVFGAASIRRPKLRRYTLHNGILNQCAAHADGRPGVYWSVLDAMSDMKSGFTRDDIVDKAVATLVKYDGRFKSNAKKACVTAFYILKTHMAHPARSNMGFGFIVEKGADKKLILRARREGETLGPKPLATVILNERG